MDKSEIFSATVDFLEFCAKNTDRKFHQCLSTVIFADVFLARLQRIRGKAKLKMKLEGKDVTRRWEQA
jgi:hypothetical protein